MNALETLISNCSKDATAFLKGEYKSKVLSSNKLFGSKSDSLEGLVHVRYRDASIYRVLHRKLYAIKNMHSRSR